MYGFYRRRVKALTWNLPANVNTMHQFHANGIPLSFLSVRPAMQISHLVLFVGATSAGALLSPVASGRVGLQAPRLRTAAVARTSTLHSVATSPTLATAAEAPKCAPLSPPPCPRLLAPAAAVRAAPPRHCAAAPPPCCPAALPLAREQHGVCCVPAKRARQAWPPSATAGAHPTEHSPLGTAHM